MSFSVTPAAPWSSASASAPSSAATNPVFTFSAPSFATTSNADGSWKVLVDCETPALDILQFLISTLQNIPDANELRLDLLSFNGSQRVLAPLQQAWQTAFAYVQINPQLTEVAPASGAACTLDQLFVFPDLAALVFSYIAATELVRLRRVSKLWKSRVALAPATWDPPNERTQYSPPRLLGIMLPKLRALCWKSFSPLPISLPRLQSLSMQLQASILPLPYDALTTLTRLELLLPPQGSDISRVSRLTRLQHLILSSSQDNNIFSTGLITQSSISAVVSLASSLIHLEVLDHLFFDPPYLITSFTALKSLRAPWTRWLQHAKGMTRLTDLACRVDSYVEEVVLPSLSSLELYDGLQWTPFSGPLAQFTGLKKLLLRCDRGFIDIVGLSQLEELSLQFRYHGRSLTCWRDEDGIYLPRLRSLALLHVEDSHLLLQHLARSASASLTYLRILASDKAALGSATALIRPFTALLALSLSSIGSHHDLPPTFAESLRNLTCLTSLTLDSFSDTLLFLSFSSLRNLRTLSLTNVVLSPTLLQSLATVQWPSLHQVHAKDFSRRIGLKEMARELFPNVLFTTDASPLALKTKDPQSEF